MVTVMFAKLTLSFVDESTGEVDHAWSAAYLFTGIFIVSIILLLFLGLRERNTDVLRPVIILRGDYCVVWKVSKQGLTLLRTSASPLSYFYLPHPNHQNGFESETFFFSLGILQRWTSCLWTLGQRRWICSRRAERRIS